MRESIESLGYGGSNDVGPRPLHTYLWGSLILTAPCLTFEFPEPSLLHFVSCRYSDCCARLANGIDGGCQVHTLVLRTLACCRDTLVPDCPKELVAAL